MGKDMQEIEKTLWAAADKMIGGLSVTNYKFVVLGLIFLKYISDTFEEKYNELVKNGATSLIIDLRNNGGGIVDEATEIGDMFTDKGTTLLIEENTKKKQTKVVAKTDKKITMKTPV